MAEQKLTIYQKLQKVLATGSVQSLTSSSNTYNIHQQHSQNDVVDIARSPKEKEFKILQAKQQKLLSRQWYRAQQDINNHSLAGLNDVRLMYRDVDLMDTMPEIGTAMDIVSEEACLSFDTEIKLLDGTIKTIEDIYKDELKNFWVYSVDENGKPKPSLVECAIYKGEKEVYEIVLDDLTKIKCTPNHKWLLSSNEWVETSDLKVGNSLMSIYDKLDYKGDVIKSKLKEVWVKYFMKFFGYKIFDNFNQQLFSHKIISIKKLNRKINVYDLKNSSCNNAFGVKCNNGLIISHNCYIGESGSLINVSSGSERVKGILQDLFVNRLSINTTLPMLARTMIKYGNAFWLLHTDTQLGVLGWKELPVYEIERYENGMDCPYTNGYTVRSNDIDNHRDETRFVWVGQQQATEYRNWQIAHFRLLYDSSMLPYGVSFLHKARRHFRMLSMMEDMMFIYRLDRSIERRVFKINVGAIDEADVPAYVQQIADNFKRTPIIDPMTGQIDLRKNIMGQTNDYFIPVREDGAASPIENLAAGQNLTAMDDIKYVQNKIVTALRVPKSFLNFEETAGDGKNLSLLDVRFMRTVNRIQQALLLELNKIATIHLLMLGFTDDLTNFTLEMANPSSQAEMLELENLAKKVTTAKDAVSDPGGGMPLTSMTWAWRHIFKWSDKEIQQNLEELRLETALAAELQQTMQIIKRTRLFDPVDNIYGEPGADYSGGGNQGGEDDGMGGVGGGGGMPMGGDMDFGDDSVGDAMGSEGEMDMGAAEVEDAAMGGPEPPMGDEGGGPPNLGEMVTKSLKKKALNEIQRRKTELLKRSSDRQADLIERYMKTISRPLKEETQQTTPIYDKAFFMNEEMNDMVSKLTLIKPSSLND